MYKHFKATCPECTEEYDLISDGVTISGKCKCGHLGFAFISQVNSRQKVEKK
jgi:hypothetical protein